MIELTPTRVGGLCIVTKGASGCDATSMTTARFEDILALPSMDECVAVWSYGHSILDPILLLWGMSS
jgi:hypothetical protein